MGHYGTILDHPSACVSTDKHPLIIPNLVMTNSSPWLLRWPIEIDGLPNLKMVIFHGELLNNQIATSGRGILIFSKHKVEPLHFVEQVA